jgi:NTP pyrophosphatase (non-canonical NTP hydrolase)
MKNLIEQLRKFAEERDWDQFHSPKNLAMGLAIESSELMEHFLWKTQAESEKPEDLDAVGRELADIFIFTLNLAARLKLDLAAVTANKLKENAAKYPKDLARGKALKHTYYQDQTDKE